MEDIYDKMSDEEKRVFVMLVMQNKSADDIMRAVQQNQKHLERIVKHIEKDRWYVAFGSDVLANILTNSSFWLLEKLFTKK